MIQSRESFKYRPISSPIALCYFSNFLLEFARKKKPSGSKKERKRGKLPNQIRHDQNAAIAVGTWKHKGESKKKKTR